MLADLIAELPEGTVVVDPDIVASYRQDRAADPNAGTAMAVVRPRRTEEVQAVMRWATAHRGGPPVRDAWWPNALRFARLRWCEA